MPSTAATLYRFLLHPLTRYVFAWIVFFAAAAGVGLISWRDMDIPARPDGNVGHALIDFGGQWVLGRMLWLGLGEHLYHRNFQREIVTQAYPREDEVPVEDRTPDEKDNHDADQLMRWFMGPDDPDQARAIGSFLTPWMAQEPLGLSALLVAQEQNQDQRVEQAVAIKVGGPLYPPIHAVVMSPFGYFRPQQAYRIMQLLSLSLSLVAGWGIVLLARRRIWWPVAATAMVVFPGFTHNLNLGQNGIWTLTVLTLGWAFLARDKPVGAGIVWGLLAFKPVWAAAFFLVLVWTGRWRVGLVMLATGACLALATLPFVGWHVWIDWLQVGRRASAIYQTDEHWIFLSRDLITIPRRWLLDFKAPPSEATNLAATLIGCSFVLGALEVTTRAVVFRQDRSRVFTGPGAAFLLLGAWMTCFHFMYYDVVLAALPVCLLLLDPGQFLRPRYLIAASTGRDTMPDSLDQYFRPGIARQYPATSVGTLFGTRNIYVINSFLLTLLALFVFCSHVLEQVPVEMSVSLPFAGNGPVPTPLKYSTSLIGTPLDVFCLIALWLWCGWSWMRMPDSAESRPSCQVATEGARK